MTPPPDRARHISVRCQECAWAAGVPDSGIGDGRAAMRRAHDHARDFDHTVIHRYVVETVIGGRAGARGAPKQAGRGRPGD